MGCVKWCDYAGELRPDKLPGSNLVTWEIVLATFSNYATNQFLGVLSSETPEVPTTFYVAINSDACTRAAQGTELTGDGYARVAISFERVSDIQRWNPADVYSPTASAEWTANSFSLHDAPTGGNYWAYGNLVSPLTVDASKAVIWKANTVVAGIGSAIG